MCKKWAWKIKCSNRAYSNIPQAKYEIYNVSGWWYMANIEDCPGFETFGADVKAARSAKHLSRKTLAEIVNIDSRYLANIEKYFNPEVMREESAQRQRISHKLKLCPEQYLTVIEGALDGALKTEKSADETEGVWASSVFVSPGRFCRPFLFEKSGILRADKGVSGIVFTGEGA